MQNQGDAAPRSSPCRPVAIAAGARAGGAMAWLRTRLRTRLRKGALLAPLVVAWGLAAPVAPQAQGGMDADSRAVLAAMSAHLGGLRSFSVEYAAVDEVVTTDGQKLQFLHSGTLAVQRPDRLHAVRRGAAGTAEMVLDGRDLVMFGRDANAFLRLPAPTIAAAVEAVQRLGFDAPGGDLLADRPMDAATTDIASGAHVGDRKSVV